MIFIHYPDKYLMPIYRISPFRTSDIAFNNTLPFDNYIDSYFARRFGAHQYKYTLNGREALNMALRYYRLVKNDVVTIFTTTGNFYVSSCVTDEIRKFCKWSRKVESRTKVILVNHEFGYPYTGLEDLKKFNLPIIEDCAHSFFLSEEVPEISGIGDFAIYSFPKMFPVQIGGLLVKKMKSSIPDNSQIDLKTIRYLRNVMSYYIKLKDEIIEERLKNYDSLRKRFQSIGLTERFTACNGVVPGVFMFRKNGLAIDLPELKSHLFLHGIQCSVFYGEESFFVPVNQSLNDKDLAYFEEVIRLFIKQKIK